MQGQREIKTKAITITFTPTLYKKIKALADAHGISINSLVNQTMAASVEKNSDSVAKIAKARADVDEAQKRLDEMLTLKF